MDMKITRTLAALFLIIGIGGRLVADPVDVATARQVALNAWTEHTSALMKGRSPAEVYSAITVAENGHPLYYVFNMTGDQGFIMISADDRVAPVLGFSVKGPYAETGHPPAFDAFMNGLRQQILLAIQGEDNVSGTVTAAWDRYRASAFTPVTLLSVGPLLQTTWDQGCYYNEFCPADANASGTCFHAVTGCGATAMAQIMKYWAYPVHGVGSFSYTHPVYGTLSADFYNATYNYSAMPASLVGSNTQVAQLIYHCGVAQVMDYGTEGSSSDIEDIDDAFRDYFLYNPSLEWKERALYPSGTWESMVKAELDASRPLLYFGNDGGAVGHAFVCDGYQGTNYFHFNWGWSGTYDGYFYLSNLAPGGNVFTDNQHAIFNLQPAQLPGAAQMDFESVSDFSLTFSPWTVNDVDGKPTYTITDHTFPHQGEAMAFIAFNPAQVSPSMSTDTEIQPHGGLRFGACFATTTPTNNDWFISPAVQLDNGGSFTMWVKSYTDTYGLEEYKVAVSTTGTNPADFTVISGPSALTAPTDWTKMTFDLSDYNNETVYVAVQCVSNDRFIFMIDDLEVDPGTTGSLIADFTANNTTIGQGQSVNFTDQSVGNPTSWQWTFQGGTPYTSDVQNPSNIVYNNPGLYDVTLTVSDGSTSNTKIKHGYIYVNQSLPSQMTMTFESLTDFTTIFDPWTTVDVNQGETYLINGITFPGQGYPMAWICFNPSTTDPPMTDVMQAHGGSKLGASFASVPPWNPNNKWLITPRMYMGVNGKLDIWVKSHTVEYGFEEYNIGVSTTDNQPGSFTILNGIHAEKAPVSWTLRSYSLSDYAGEEVYIGIQCVSNDAFIFMIDDLSITSTVGMDEQAAASLMVWPNPARDRVLLQFKDNAPESYSGELHNTIGMKVRAFTAEGNGFAPYQVDVSGLAEGVYFLKIAYGSTTFIKKIIILE